MMFITRSNRTFSLAQNSQCDGQMLANAFRFLFVRRAYGNGVCVHAFVK